jgi:hypothetical protein
MQDGWDVNRGAGFIPTLRTDNTVDLCALRASRAVYGQEFYTG